ncbi:PepSY-associated TM helix domain-containing protein [Sphingobacterium sp. SYP-B4668]|uniref:PepSY-associated TM helix domain-containing protein n=1 Tax=Sphingobacterium sp. SYP-B4668 TaxID=2996035 RepID=UPI0022DCF970|nr:PepSY-associated TM helix domain-containing protein [Sphingobacterium sp. SYP-B4668]
MNKSKKSNSRWPRVRKLFNDLHLWFGLISGIVVFVVCLTGTIYVYNTEIREAAAPELYQVKEGAGARLQPDALLDIAQQNIKGKVSGIRINHDPERAYAVLYSKPKKEEPADPAPVEEKKMPKKEHAAQGNNAEDKKGGKDKKVAAAPAGRQRANQMMIDPYSGQLLGDPQDKETKTAAFMQKMFSLHRWLMLNEIEQPIFEGVENRKLGSWITGTATLLFTLGVISGIVIWFPQRLRGWKNGLKIKWSAKWKRVNHDLHNTFGFYSCIILFLMGVTGPFWSFDWYRTGWQKTWGTYKEAPKEGSAAPKEEPKLASIYPGANVAPLSVAQLVAIADKELTYSGDYMVSLAKDSVSTVSLSKYKVGFFAPAPADKLTLDQYSGKVLEKDIFKEKPLNERISASIKSLHIGDVYGPFTKLLYFISCLIATSLPITGVMIWLNKMKKTKKRGASIVTTTRAVG